KHPNEWYARHARRILQERFSRAGNVSDRSSVAQSLSKIAFENAKVSVRLRGLWSLNAIGEWTVEVMQRAVKDNSEHVCSWALRLDAEHPTGVMSRKALAFVA